MQFALSCLQAVVETSGRFLARALIFASALGSLSAYALDELVKKQAFEIKSFKTIEGKTIKNLRFGFETYGTLSPNKDNVILLCHGSTNTSHFAGKYHANDTEPGVWDAIIGPGKVLDTNRFFIIATDSIANPNALDPHVITTGPASVNLDTGHEYGMTFPIVTIADFVEAQKALLESPQFGIKKLYAVMGYSMGGMQTLEWATRYPNRVERAIPVIAQIEQNDFNIMLKSTVADIIRLDPEWNNGDYYKRGQPMKGLAVAFKAHLMSSIGPRSLDNQERDWARANRDPGRNWNNRFAVEEFVDHIVQSAIQFMDANSLIYTGRALNLFNLGHRDNVDKALARIKAKTLFIASKSDLLMFPEYSRDAVKQMRENGQDVDYFEFKGQHGHQEFRNIAQASRKLRKILRGCTGLLEK